MPDQDLIALLIASLAADVTVIYDADGWHLADPALEASIRESRIGNREGSRGRKAAATRRRYRTRNEVA